MANREKKRIHFVSLGCPKNRVDSEVMLGVAARSGYDHVDAPEDADVIVVNTCGFIDAAKQESIDTILSFSELKKSGSLERLVVAGCLSQRYSGDLEKELPEVDHFLGSSDMLKLERVLEGRAERLLVGNPADWVPSASDPRVVSTRGASAYLKLAEGCNRKCSFCVIPQIRGKQRSRTPDDVVEEARRLADAGVLELNLVSQDTVAYGRDLSDAPSLASVVRRIADVPGLRWVRIFYLYPEKLDEALLDLLANHPRVVPYVDMPLQHAADAMLRRMRRGHGGKRQRDVVSRLREKVPNLTMRTAFIVGHPGETDEEFQELCDFVEWAEFDRVGVFHYSDEETCHAHTFEGKVPRKVALQRAKQLMKLQRGISKRKNRALVGRSVEVLVEGPSEESELVLVGRHAGQAPEIDGQVFLSGGEARPGEMVNVTIRKATDYDLLGELSEDEAADATRVAARGAKKRGTKPAEPPSLVHRASDGRRVTLRTVS
ncbi:MAG TPA: 30S ribosomal protein S12 methylthiotransferase RimO [Polyangiaceae bacterium]|nr:30S ribosomal protein S12 methylthiotransferase RimO [Polyangiaceae bacterium]